MLSLEKWRAKAVETRAINGISLRDYVNDFVLPYTIYSSSTQYITSKRCIFITGDSYLRALGHLKLSN